MSGFEQLLSGSLGTAGGASVLPVWMAGALAALLFFAGVLAFPRAAQPGRAGLMGRVALLAVGAGLMWVLADSLGGRDRSTARHLIDARSMELTLRAIAPGSPLACLDTVANETVEAGCEKAVFANPQTVAAAVAYVDARLNLLADHIEVAGRDRGQLSSFERMRRALEADRFGFVAHVLAGRGCTADTCAAFRLFRDPRRLAANIRERVFDANIIVNAAAWGTPSVPSVALPAPVAVAPPAPSSPALASAPVASTTGVMPPSAKYDFPSSASIPAISIMNAEPPMPPGENAVPTPLQQQGGTPPAAPKPAPRRQPPRESTAQQQQALPPPLPPPGTIANPR